MFSALFWLIIVCAVVIAFYFLSPKGFTQVVDTARSKTLSWCSNLWSSDPIAIKNSKVNEKSNEIANAVTSAEQSQASILNLEWRVDKLEKESNRLQGLAEQYVKDGNDVKASEKLEEKESLDKDLSESKKQLAAHKEMLKQHMSQINRSAGQISKLKKQAKDQGMRLHFAKADAELSRMSKVLGKNVDFSDFEDVDDAIETKINSYKAVREISSQLVSEDNEDQKMEEKMRQEKVQDKLKALKEKMKVS